MTRQNRAFLDAGLRDRLHLFVQKSCTTLNPGTPFEPNWHIEAMCHQLERVRRGEVQRLFDHCSAAIPEVDLRVSGLRRLLLGP
jgi:hypothetical protein